MRLLGRAEKAAPYVPQRSVGDPLAGARDLLESGCGGAAEIAAIARQERSGKAVNQFRIDVRCCHGRHSMRAWGRLVCSV